MGTTDVTLPEDLLEKATVVAEVTRNDRDEIVAEALREYLAAVEDDEEFRATLVDRYLAEEIGFETLSEILGREDAEVVRASKPILDRGEEIADELADGD